jgi:hypothetical protein
VLIIPGVEVDEKRVADICAPPPPKAGTGKIQKFVLRGGAEFGAPVAGPDLDVDNAPGVWRDFGNNVARSSAHRPWMPALGNHECEFGVDTMSGKPDITGAEIPNGTATCTRFYTGGLTHDAKDNALVPDYSGEGTVYLVLGGGGTNGPTNTYGTDMGDDKPQAKVITTRKRRRRDRGDRVLQERRRLGRGRALVRGSEPHR